MRKHIGRIISVLMVMAMTACSVHKISFVLQRKESSRLFSSFFSETKPIDVIFIGSSHVKYGFFPMELWQDYGIASYNLASKGNPIPVSYWTLVNALDYQIPEVVVMDIYDAVPFFKVYSIEKLHIAWDAFPLNMNKYRALNDLLVKGENTGEYGETITDDKWEFIFTLGQYHSRWNELLAEDFYNQKYFEEYSAVWKGADPLHIICDREEYTYTDKPGLRYDDVAKEYLVRIIQLCHDKDIDLLLVNTGYDCNDEAKFFADSVPEIAEKYDVSYLDFTESDIINFDSDLASTGDNTHINFSGAEKFTEYIGTVLSQQYQLPDHREDIRYRDWWDNYELFVESKTASLKKQDVLQYYLLLLADKDYNIAIKISDMEMVYEDHNADMLTNLGVETDKLEEGVVVVINRTCDEVRYFDDHDMETGYEFVLDDVHVVMNSTGIFLGDQAIYAEDGETGVRIAVIRRETGEIIDVRGFY